MNCLKNKNLTKLTFKGVFVYVYSQVFGYVRFACTAKIMGSHLKVISLVCMSYDTILNGIYMYCNNQIASTDMVFHLIVFTYA